MRDKSIALYKPPFVCRYGQIWDSENHMVADNPGADAVLRIRGWGRIQYIQDAEQLQDDVGNLIAQILTEHWPKPDDPK